MMHMPLHQPGPIYQSLQPVFHAQLNEPYADHPWISDQTIASATTTNAKIPIKIIPSRILAAMEPLETAGQLSPEGPNKTFFDYRSSADSAYGSPDNITHDRGDISPTTRLSPFTSPKASIDIPRRAPPKSFHLPLDAHTSPRGSLSSTRGQNPAALQQRPDLKVRASESALNHDFKNHSGLPHFKGPSPHVRQPSNPKNRQSRMDLSTNTFTESSCTMQNHANLERKMSLLEKRIEGLMPALSTLTQAINGLAATFEHTTSVRHASVQTFKPPFAESRQPSSSTLAGQNSPLGSFFDINPFTDRRTLGSVSERIDAEPAKATVRNGSINSRPVEDTDSDDENDCKRVEAWRSRPRQQSRWDTETESEEDESDESPTPPLPALSVLPSNLPSKASALSYPLFSPSTTVSTVGATSPRTVLSPRKSLTSVAAAVMRGSIGKKPGVVSRLDQYRPSIALPSMHATHPADIPPLPSFCTPNQRYHYQTAVAQSAPPDMATFPTDLQDSPPPSSSNSKLVVPHPLAFASHFPVKPISLPPTPSGSFIKTFPDGGGAPPSPSIYSTRTSPSPSFSTASGKPFILAPSPSLTAQAPTLPVTVLPMPLNHQQQQKSSTVPAPRAAWYFFYGPLVDPALLVELLGLPAPPTLHPARVHGRDLKFFGPYPAAISHRVPLSSTVEGQAWYVPSAQMAAWLRKHEEEDFVEVDAEIEFAHHRYGSSGLEEDDDSSEGLVLGRMFEWRGDVGGLMDGPSI